MAAWLPIFLLLVTIIFPLLRHSKTPTNLPPGPRRIPFFGNLFWLTTSFSDLKPLLRRLHAAHGPILNIYVGSRPTIFIADQRLAYLSLVQNSLAFSDRPRPLTTGPNLHSINNTPHGTLWRLLRRNLATEVFRPHRLQSTSHIRRQAAAVLLSRLRAEAGRCNGIVVPSESFKHAISIYTTSICFGQMVDNEVSARVADVQHGLLSLIDGFCALNLMPTLAIVAVLCWRRRRFLDLRREQKELFLPIIRARKRKQQQQHEGQGRIDLDANVSYVDSLLELKISDEAGDRKLNDDEILSFCSEFLEASITSVAAALEWIMANLVKHPDIQEKLWKEINAAATEEEDELDKLKYLKAVVMEGLRRHPPAQFVLPHAVKEDTSLSGYNIPKGAVLNYEIEAVGLNEEAWEDATEFKPERFLAGGEGEKLEMTGGGAEIKMMPFGIGRRTCPGAELVVVHLKHFVAFLVKEFRWAAVEGKEVDLTERAGIFFAMKEPLHARIIARRDEA